MRRPVLSAAMRAAYARTGYEAAGVVARIGRRNPALDRLLRARGVRRAGFVTAWNPWSRPMPRGWNDRMLDRLRQAARGRVLAEGWGRGEGRGSGWAERHLLVAGDPRWIARLARRFRQHALVMVGPGLPGRILPALHPRARPAPPAPGTKPEAAR